MLAARKLGFQGYEIEEMTEDQIWGWIEAYYEILNPDKGKTHKIRRKKGKR